KSPGPTRNVGRRRDKSKDIFVKRVATAHGWTIPGGVVNRDTRAGGAIAAISIRGASKNLHHTSWVGQRVLQNCSTRVRDFKSEVASQRRLKRNRSRDSSVDVIGIMQARGIVHADRAGPASG